MCISSGCGVQSNMQSDSSYDIRLDIIKGIAIILVVMGHCIQYGSGNDYYTSALFLKKIYLNLYIVFTCHCLC